MRRVHVFMVALVVALTAPSTLHAACMCGMTESQAKARRPWNERDRIFIGEVLDADTLTGSRRKSVTFLTQESWRGEMPDTVTLLISEDAGCVYYYAGQRYLVHADLSSPSATTLATSVCDGSWTADHPVSRKRIAELGPAPWRAPPMGSRALDSVAICIGEKAPGDSADAHITFVMPLHPFNSVARFEIAQYDWPHNNRRALVYLPPGLYQFRMTWKDGTSYASYVLLQCGPKPSGSRCQVFRYFPKAALCPPPAGPPFLVCQVDAPPAPAEDRALPLFPPSLLEDGVSESVRISYVVDTTGRVDVRTLTFARPPHRLLEATLRNAIPSWRFRPGTLGGQMVSVRLEEVYAFHSQAGSPPLALRTVHDTLRNGLPRTTIGRPLRDRSAAEITAQDLMEAQWSAIARLIQTGGKLSSVRVGTSPAKVCVAVLHGDDAPESAAEGLRRTQRMMRAVTGETDCPRTYASMHVLVDSLGRRVDAPPRGWVDPYWVRITKATPWSRDAVVIEAGIRQGPGGHGYLCGVERTGAGWEATCNPTVVWAN